MLMMYLSMRYCLSLIRSNVISNYNHDAEFRGRDGVFWLLYLEICG
jgi:hypothetical protein